MASSLTLKMLFGRDPFILTTISPVLSLAGSSRTPAECARDATF